MDEDNLSTLSSIHLDSKSVSCCFGQASTNHTFISCLSEAFIYTYESSNLLKTNSYTLNSSIIKGIASPHDLKKWFILTNDQISQIDCRSSTVNQIPITHNIHQGLMDVQFNPNNPNQFSTGGKDGYVRFWDIRNSTKCLMEITNHSHWILSTEYNPFHDQLFVTCGSDCLVNLFSIVSISSGGLKHDSEDEPNEYGHSVDGIIKVFDHHEDSVYKVNWSHGDPWLFGSLSFDGNFIINRVPDEEKYKIIL